MSADKSSRTIQQMVDAAQEAQKYCTDGYGGYLDVIFPGKHVFNVHNKSDTFTVEGVNANLRHYIPTAARRSRCFPRKPENLQAVLTVFVRAYNRFGAQKIRYRSCHPGAAVLFLSLTSFNSAFGQSLPLEKYQDKHTSENELEELFSRDCFALGFTIDCGESFIARYGNDAFRGTDGLKKMIGTVDNVELLAAAIFSH